MSSLTTAWRRASDRVRPGLSAALRPLGLWAWVIAGTIALSLFAVGWPVSVTLDGIPVATAMVSSFLLSAPIVTALRWPRRSALAHLLGVFLTAGTAGAQLWPATVMTILALGFMVVVLAFAARWWLSALTWAVACLGLAIMASAPERYESSATPDLIVTASVSLALMISGLLLAAWARARSDLGEALVEAQAEHEARTWAEERSRVAREMHDVVAHSMSIVHMRATSAKYRIGDLPPEAVEEFDGIAAQAREALGQMRGVLGVLRGDDAAQLAPQPGLPQLPELIEGARAADIDISSQLARVVPEPSPAVQLALYRVTQEAIANVVRHAPDAKVSVELESGPDLTLTITSVGGAPTESPDRGGAGIRGMIERMKAIGGTLQAGPIAGGFRVQAVAPHGASTGQAQ